MDDRLYLTGINIKESHYKDLLNTNLQAAWLSVSYESHVYPGLSTDYLMKLRSKYPICIRPLGLSLGSTDELSWVHLKKIEQMISMIKPCLIVDKLAWSSFAGQYFHQYLPLPYTEDSLRCLTDRIQSVQDYLKRTIAIENVNNSCSWIKSELGELEFFNELVARTGCQLVINSSELSDEFINKLRHNPLAKNTVQAIIVNLSSQSQQMIHAKQRYFQLLELLGNKPTIVESSHFVPLDMLYNEACIIESYIRRSHEIVPASK